MRTSLPRLVLAIALTACGSKPPPAAPAPVPTTCAAGDHAVASQTACLQDDAACYQLVDGSWCTGSRPGSGAW